MWRPGIGAGPLGEMLVSAALIGRFANAVPCLLHSLIRANWWGFIGRPLCLEAGYLHAACCTALHFGSAQCGAQPDSDLLHIHYGLSL